MRLSCSATCASACEPATAPTARARPLAQAAAASVAMGRAVVPGDRGGGGVLADAAATDAGLRQQRQVVALHRLLRAGRERGAAVPQLAGAAGCGAGPGAARHRR